MIYTLYLNFKERIMEYTLPSVKNCRHTVDITHEMGSQECILDFEVIDGQWRMFSNKYTDISPCEDGSTVLSDNILINVSVKNTSVSFVITVSGAGGNLHGFSKYICTDNVLVGNNARCDICITDELVSHRHCIIEKNDGVCTVTDLSTNGIYINNIRAQKKTVLKMFDTIYIFGTKVIYLGNIIAVSNNPDVSVSLDKCTEKYAVAVTENDTGHYFSDKILNRYQADEFSVSLEAPKLYGYPDKENVSFKNIFSSSALLTLGIACIKKDISVLSILALFSGSSLIIALMTALAENIRIKKLCKKISEENNRLENHFITESLKVLDEKTDNYRCQLEICYPGVESFINEEELCFAYRNRKDSDFFRIRAGTGNFDIFDRISTSEKFDYKKYSFVQDYYTLKNVPITLEFDRHSVIGLAGTKEEVYETTSALATECASLFSPSDIKFMTFYNLSETEYFSFMRWFPHSFSEDMSMRYTACTDRSYKNVLFSLTNELSDRARQRDEGFEGKFFPHYIVFCSDNKIFRDEAVEKYINFKEGLGVTFIFMYHSLSCINQRCDTVLHLSEGYIENVNNKTRVTVDRFERVSLADADLFARKLMAKYDDKKINNEPVTDMISYFDMMSVKSVDEFDIIKNYKVNRADDGISACIGVGENKKKFYLDMHEKKHGPHGLVAGMTGSGKSEALQTLVISLALRYHPDELAFVLIDYKGGGMSDIFENLPHTAGVVTNLTESLSSGYDQIRRILISLSSEIKKRQMLFKNYKVNHVDDYMKLFREGKAEEPCPHLIIIVDEFAELKREQTDFISRLVSTARIGRSLGLHLILATQKPTGVVDDEIWGNSRFRLCLKVQDKADSTGMLKKPDASQLTVVGRAYIQIGNDEIFDMIQTGYAGAPYDPDISSDSTYMIDIDGTESVVKAPVRRSGAVLSQLDITVDYIIRTCRENNIPDARKLWCNPLPELILYEKFSEYTRTKSGKYLCQFGFTDDPEKQDIYPSAITSEKLSDILIVGNTGSGKTTLAQTIIYDLAFNHSPDILKIEIFDFTGGLYEAFSLLPHCRGVHTEINEDELMKFLNSISAKIERRRKLFLNSGHTNFKEYSEENEDMCAEFILFDGYYIFKEMYPAYEDDFMKITRECAKYGIYFIVTLKQVSDMKFRIRNNFQTVIALRLSDRAEYAELFGIRPEFRIPDIAGRGFITENNKIYEFQATVCATGSGKQKTLMLREKISQITEKYPSLTSEENVVLDISCSDVYCCDLENISRQDYFELAVNLAETKDEVVMWFEKNDIPSEILSLKNVSLFKGIDGLYAMLFKLKDEFSSRNAQKKQCGKYHGTDIAVMINDMDDFLRCIYDEKYKENMSNITEVFWKNGEGLGITFISSLNEKSVYRGKEAYKIFKSYGKGKRNA